MRDKAPGHTPPMYNHDRFEVQVPSVVANKKVDKLHNVKVPAQWDSPPRIATRSALRTERAASMLPHASFDVDGDGMVGQQDYSIAKKHDLASSGMLTGGQRDSAIAETCHRVGSRLHEDEIGGNARVRRILTSLRDEPELNDTVKREQRLRTGQLAVATLKMKSSQQLKQCLAFPEPHAQPDGGPAYTRTMLLQQRRMENANANAAGRDHYLRETGLLFD